MSNVEILERMEARSPATPSGHEPARGRRPSPAERVPPFALPGEHFAAALCWLVLGAAGLLAVAPELARGAYLSPRVIGVTHAFTLGWITTSIFGALTQIYPVALGVGARSVRVGHMTFWLLQAGTALLVAGAWWWRPRLLALGWVVLFFAVGGMSWNLLPARRKARRGRRIGAYVSAGHMGLGLAMLVIAASVGSFQGWWSADRLGVLSAHVHLAVAGFATLTAIGVGSQLLPNFLHARGHPEWPLRWIGPLVFGGLVAFAAGEIWTVPAATGAGGALVAIGMALYLYQATTWYRGRGRRGLERPTLLIAIAHLFLAGALGVGLLLLAGRGAGNRLVIVYGLLGILGWLALLVAGVYGRIVPLLSWMNRFAWRVREPGTPTVADLAWVGAERARIGLLAAGVALLAHGAGAADPIATFAGAALFAAGALLLAIDGLRLIVPALRSGPTGHRRPAPRSTTSAPLPVLSGSDPTEETHMKDPLPVSGTAPRAPGTATVRTLDVRPRLAAGEEPLSEILEVAAGVPEGEAFEVIAPFEPVPLYGELSRQGFAHRTEPRSPEAWAVRFTRTGVTPTATVAAVSERYPETARVLAAHGVDACCGGEHSLKFVAAAHRIELDRLLAELQEAIVAHGPVAVRDDAGCGCGGCACAGAPSEPARGTGRRGGPSRPRAEGAGS